MGLHMQFYYAGADGVVHEESHGVRRGAKLDYERINDNTFIVQGVRVILSQPAQEIAREMDGTIDWALAVACAEKRQRTQEDPDMGVGTASSSAATEVTVTELLGELGNCLSNINGRGVTLAAVVLGAEPDAPIDGAPDMGLIGCLRALLQSARQIDERLERVVRAL